MKLGERTLSIQNLRDFNFDETKKNVWKYFLGLERLQIQWAKLNAQKGMTANYNFEVEFKKQPYSPIGKDDFSLIAKEFVEDEINNYISMYFWACEVLTEEEKLYVDACFLQRKHEGEIINLLGYRSIDDNDFRVLKKSAVFKFAEFMNLVIYK